MSYTDQSLRQRHSVTMHCMGGMQRGHAEGTCRGDMQREHAEGTCRGDRSAGVLVSAHSHGPGNDRGTLRHNNVSLRHHTLQVEL